MMKKIDVLKDLMAKNEWKKAISLASKFPRLGNAKDAIKSAQMAYTNPNFVRQIKKDPDKLIYQGIQALIAKYG
ncbi:TPA: hypothetical protein ACPIWO_000458 [Haemophilus influenzae]|uniref:Uncharacterized protein n=2 Tax=Haemophilus influenzae TaxID=727 RepID=Q4QKW4_HAEI8|nr:hypothetical protein [Haemophilus influenzae]DAO38258.1 MAG TPA: hypothetical protein [Caudoviricetes sp.]AAX88333.1 hypothetical protein NTHI1525 [Haemophilus influenzae 86-028NP]EEW77731.1 conserved hypothetical protein [Haemophilus influenzae NT127]KOR01350.1 hypothetical protein ABW52_06520 [Haemophilus influenzae]MBG0850154.1 hypothetical protein [Haemophilus influenzae]